jgi:hypothetical protein
MKTPPVNFTENQIEELIKEIQCLRDLLKEKNATCGNRPLSTLKFLRHESK